MVHGGATRAVSAARRRPVDEHLHDGDLVGELVLAEGEHVGLHAQDPQRDQALAQAAPWRARRRLLGSPGESERVEEVGRLQLRVVVEAGGQHPVDDPRAGLPAGPDLRGRRCPGPRARASSGTARLGAPSSTEATVRRFGTQPAPCGEGKKAGSPRASQSSRPAGSVKPATGFHAAEARVRDADRQPSVPREVLELDGPREDCGAEARLGVVARRSRRRPSSPTFSGSARSVYPATIRSHPAPRATRAALERRAAPRPAVPPAARRSWRASIRRRAAGSRRASRRIR